MRFKISRTATTRSGVAGDRARVAGAGARVSRIGAGSWRPEQRDVGLQDRGPARVLAVAVRSRPGGYHVVLQPARLLLVPGRGLAGLAGVREQEIGAQVIEGLAGGVAACLAGAGVAGRELAQRAVGAGGERAQDAVADGALVGVGDERLELAAAKQAPAGAVRRVRGPPGDDGLAQAIEVVQGGELGVAGLLDGDGAVEGGLQEALVGLGGTRGAVGGGGGGGGERHGEQGGAHEAAAQVTAQACGVEAGLGELDGEQLGEECRLKGRRLDLIDDEGAAGPLGEQSGPLVLGGEGIRVSGGEVDRAHPQRVAAGERVLGELGGGGGGGGRQATELLPEAVEPRLPGRAGLGAGDQRVTALAHPLEDAVRGADAGERCGLHRALALARRQDDAQGLTHRMQAVEQLGEASEAVELADEEHHGRLHGEGEGRVVDLAASRS